MILISHRGNLDGKNESEENNPLYIEEALNAGYEVEIDVWYKYGEFYLALVLALPGIAYHMIHKHIYLCRRLLQ